VDECWRLTMALGGIKKYLVNYTQILALYGNLVFQILNQEKLPNTK
jgi:hypothetical protein